MTTKGYLISDKPFTVMHDGGRKVSYMAGVNKDVTPEEAEHWYVKANGAHWVADLAEAHKQTPELRSRAVAARAEWERATRDAISAQISSQTLRVDLERLEAEFGVDTRAADAIFEESLSGERERARALQDEAEKRAGEQRRQDEDAKAAADKAAADKKSADEKKPDEKKPDEKK